MRRGQVNGLGRLVKIVVLVLFFYLLFPQETYAYLDPGSGSFIIQLLIGGLVAFLVVLRGYWGRIRGFFTKKTGSNASEAPATSTHEESSVNEIE
jgi:hypothetical protein